MGVWFNFWLTAAYKHADGKKIDGRRVLVDVERARTVKGWLPRRLGKPKIVFINFLYFFQQFDRKNCLTLVHIHKKQKVFTMSKIPLCQ